MVAFAVLTALVFEALRRIPGAPQFGNVRGTVIMAAASAAVAAVSLLVLAFLFPLWPFADHVPG
ncbi:MAG: hypothetical protein ACREEB_13105 [Caulobacteraceae bacterium]